MYLPAVGAERDERGIRDPACAVHDNTRHAVSAHKLVDDGRDLRTVGEVALPGLKARGRIRPRLLLVKPEDHLTASDEEFRSEARALLGVSAP